MRQILNALFWLIEHNDLWYDNYYNNYNLYVLIAKTAVVVGPPTFVFAVRLATEDVSAEVRDSLIYFTHFF